MAVSNSKRHTDTRTVPGEQDGQCVAEFLNSAPPEAQERIEPLVRELKEAARYLRPAARKGYLRSLDSDRVKGINRRLEPYKTIPILHSASSSSGNFIFEDVPAKFWSTEDEAEYKECEAVRALLELAKMNLLGSLRQCELNQNWFFARKKDQRFCSTSCRIRFNQGTPRAREYHRAKQREYYEIERHKREAAKREIEALKQRRRSK